MSFASVFSKFFVRRNILGRGGEPFLQEWSEVPPVEGTKSDDAERLRQIRLLRDTIRVLDPFSVINDRCKVHFS